MQNVISRVTALLAISFDICLEKKRKEHAIIIITFMNLIDIELINQTEYMFLLQSRKTGPCPLMSPFSI